MNENKFFNKDNSKDATEMYLNPDTAKTFAEREKNDEKWHSVVSNILDTVVVESFKGKEINIANLGAGANPQKYQGILEKLQKGSKMDWVDISPTMLEMAQEKDEIPKESINFIKGNFRDYFSSKEKESLDAVMMQYSINYIDNLDDFLSSLYEKLKDHGIFVANIGGNNIQNGETVSFLVNGKEITGTTELKDGDKYTINFLDSDGNIEGSTTKNFFSYEKIESVAKENGLKFSLNTLKDGGVNTNLLILKK